MKKIFAIISMVALLSVTSMNLYAQDADSTQTEAVAVEETVADVPAASEEIGEPMHQILKQKFMEGGVEWMAPLLLCLILGLAIIIERVIYLNLSSTNTKKLITKIEAALAQGGVEEAMTVCRNTRGPVASIFYQGLLRSGEGVEIVEKTVSAYGSIQAGRLESGLSWISLFIAAAPMLGFMGTVVGMIGAFDAIEAAGDIAPSLVAGGIKVALLTTVGGLIVALILQFFYNYLVSKIDSIIITMEDSSISLIDLLNKYFKK